MISVILILAVAIIIVIIEVPPLVKAKQTKVLTVFSILLLFGVIVSIAQSLHWNVPNPSDWITYIFEPWYKIISSLLK